MNFRPLGREQVCLLYYNGKKGFWQGLSLFLCFLCEKDFLLPADLNATEKRWKIGDWTDDTDMMLCIADSVIEDKGVNFLNIAKHYKAWANGVPMGIGEHTYKVLMIADYVEKPFKVSHMVWKISGCQSAANGGLMRTSIVGLFPKEVRTCAENICKLTHYDPRCIGNYSAPPQNIGYAVKLAIKSWQV